ncbi:hypothetical protein Tco_0469386 [Tanacetum coccineum]
MESLHYSFTIVVEAGFFKGISFNESVNISHLFYADDAVFRCPMASDIHRLICRWWGLPWSPLGSYAEWLSWFKDIRLGSKVKSILEGVCYVSWWCLWIYRNQLLFATVKPRKDYVVVGSYVVNKERGFLSSGGRGVKQKKNLNTMSNDATVGKHVVGSSVMSKLVLVGDDGIPLKPLNVDGQASAMDYFTYLSNTFDTPNSTTTVATASSRVTP